MDVCIRACLVKYDVNFDLEELLMLRLPKIINTSTTVRTSSLDIASLGNVSNPSKFLIFETIRPLMINLAG